MRDTESVIASDRECFEIEVEAQVYSLEVCKKACYALMNYISCNIRTAPNSYIISASVTGDHSKAPPELESLLLDELLDYSLRQSISSQTEVVRNIILSNAFSNTKIIE